MLEWILDVSQIIIADIVLSGDNALIIGMAAATVPEKNRKKVIFIGLMAAAVLRIIFALVASYLISIPGLLLLGGLLLFWVCWRLFVDIRENTKGKTLSKVGSAETKEINTTEVPQKSMVAALISITIADISMSLDNVLAVAAIADGDKQILIFGLALAIVLMAFSASLIMKLLTKFPWISWLGLFVLLYVAGEMFYRGFFDLSTGVGPMLGIVEGWEISKGH